MEGLKSLQLPTEIINKIMEYVPFEPGYYLSFHNTYNDKRYLHKLVIETRPRSTLVPSIRWLHSKRAINVHKIVVKSLNMSNLYFTDDIHNMLNYITDLIYSPVIYKLDDAFSKDYYCGSAIIV